MVWRSVLISNPVNLKLENRQLLVETEKEKTKIPVEDLALIVIDGYAKITSSLLSALAENNVVLVICDRNKIPSAIFNSYCSHFHFADILQKQLAMTLPFKKRIWQKIIQQKIYNQSLVLFYLGKENHETLKNYAKKVDSGDSKNVEGTGARLYWKSLFGEGFKRMKEDFYNHALNYAYTILRSAVIRGIVARGLFPVLGVHHSNKLNQFLLADDFIEPFRATVDLAVYKLIERKEDEVAELTKNDKMYLINIINYDVKIHDEHMTILRAVEDMASSYIDSMNKNDVKVFYLPEVLNEH